MTPERFERLTSLTSETPYLGEALAEIERLGSELRVARRLAADVVELMVEVQSCRPCIPLEDAFDECRRQHQQRWKGLAVRLLKLSAGALPRVQ